MFRRGATKGPSWDEDLFWVAKRGTELARQCCTCSSSYHLLWSALRASGYKSGYAKDEPILASLVSPLLKNHARVLIAGSADTAILSGVMRISNGSPLDISVIDKCEAPLALISEYVKQKGASCRTLCSDIIDLDGEDKWDLIILHYTSMFFDRANRRQYFEALVNSLDSNGFLVCADRVGGPPASMASSELELAYFTKAQRAMRDSPLRHMWERAALDDLLRDYARAHLKHRRNFPKVGEIEEILNGLGLSVVSRTETDVRKLLKTGTNEEMETNSGQIILATRNNQALH